MDFRLMTVGKVWQSVRIEANDEQAYVGQVEKPEEGFAAYFVEMIYAGPLGMDYSFTTQIGIPGKAGDAPAEMDPILLLLPIVLLVGGVIWMIRR